MEKKSATMQAQIDSMAAALSPPRIPYLAFEPNVPPPGCVQTQLEQQSKKLKRIQEHLGLSDEAPPPEPAPKKRRARGMGRHAAVHLGLGCSLMTGFRAECLPCWWLPTLGVTPDSLVAIDVFLTFLAVIGS